MIRTISSLFIAVVLLGACAESKDAVVTVVKQEEPKEVEQPKEEVVEAPIPEAVEETPAGVNEEPENAEQQEVCK